MSLKATTKWRILLDTTAMDDLERAALVSGIQKVSAQSPLMQVTEIASSVKALGTKELALATYIAAVAADEKQLKTDATAVQAQRAVVDLELVTLKSLVTREAKSAGDVTGMGFTLASGTTSRAVPAAPIVLQKAGKQHGKTRVAVAGTTRGRFVAESSPDPIAAWTSLPGTGKARTLTGATGTKLWVRFAQVRYGLQSDWSTPVLVTIP